jgi:hypothetical protein
MLDTVQLFMRDACVILATYLTLGIRKSVSLNVFNLDQDD